MEDIEIDKWGCFFIWSIIIFAAGCFAGGYFATQNLKREAVIHNSAHYSQDTDGAPMFIWNGK